MIRALIAYLATGLVFCIVDFLWLGVVAQGFYKSQLGGLLLDKPNMAAAALFYGLFVAGVIVFAVLPALEADNWIRAALLSAFLGLIAYATYDLSNLATLKGWTVAVAVVDMLWGAVVTGIAGTAGFFITRWLLRIS